MNWRERINVDPNVCHGRACIERTRVMLSGILKSCLVANLFCGSVVANKADDVAKWDGGGHDY